MPNPSADEAHVDRPWRDFEGYVRDAVDEMRSRGWGKLDLMEELVRRRFKTIVGIASDIGAEIELQDTSPPKYPGDEARIRLSLDGRDPIAFQGKAELSVWMRANMKMLRARFERARLAQVTAAPTTTTDHPSVRPRRAL